jgi:hypothetical protein
MRCIGAITTEVYTVSNSVRIPWRAIGTGAAIAGIGLALGVAVAPPLAALRPLPPPIVERIPIHTADVLDTGPACVYTWSRAVFIWSRAHLNITETAKCPVMAEAFRRWREAQLAPVAMFQPSDGEAK